MRKLPKSRVSAASRQKEASASREKEAYLATNQPRAVEVDDDVWASTGLQGMNTKYYIAHRQYVAQEIACCARIEDDLALDCWDEGSIGLYFTSK